MTYLYEYEIHIAGIQRSGLHALSNWLLGNFNTAVYRNDAAYNIYQGAYKFEFFKEGKKVNTFKDPKRAEAIIICHENGSYELLQEYQKNPAYLRSITRACEINGVDCFSRKQLCYLNLRDPYNNLASAWKLFQDKKLLTRLVNIWINTATAIRQGIEEENIVPVLFNRWSKDTEYRRNLFITPKKVSDKNFKKMMGYGGGSSFSKSDHKEDATKLQLNNRWESFKEDSFYKSLFEKNPELKLLSENLFGLRPF